VVRCAVVKFRRKRMSGSLLVVSNTGMVVFEDGGAMMSNVRVLALARSTKDFKVAKLSSNRES